MIHRPCTPRECPRDPVAHFGKPLCRRWGLLVLIPPGHYLLRLKRPLLIKVPFGLAAQTRSALHQRTPESPLQETLLSNVQTPFSDPSRNPVGTGRRTPSRSLGACTAPPRTRQEQRGRNSVTSRPRSRVRGGPSPPRAGRRDDATRWGGAESLVPRSGVSAPHSGGAELETGRLGLQPGSAGFGRLRAGRAGGGGRGRGQGRRALVVAGAPVTGSEAGWSGADGDRWVGRGLTDGRGSQWRGGRLLAGGDWRVRACAEVARGAERRSIGWNGQGVGRAADVREWAPRRG